VTGSIRGRFVFTICANILRSGLAFSTGLLLARWLGPTLYGDMSFLIGTFMGLRQLLDMGSSSAFFTFLSQRPRSRRFVWSFFAWLFVQFVVPLLAIGVLFPEHWIKTTWQGEQRSLVLLAFVAAFLQNSVWPVIQQAGESQRGTRWVQGVGVSIAAAHLAAVVLLRRFGALGLGAVFLVIAVEYALAAVVAHGHFEYATEAEAVEGGPEPGMEKYLAFCLPMIAYSCVGFAYTFADDWLLQIYGGGTQQAFYAIGAQFAGVSLIATTSVLSIFWKEIAEANHRGDRARAGTLYRRISRLLFLVGAAIAGFLMPWTDALLRYLLGAAYAGGAAAMMIMFVYPIHQSMGQIGGTMLFATERTSIQVSIGIAFMIASMAVTYFVLAPVGAAVPGLGLAAAGLAVKMVVMQVIQVNVIAYVIAKIWGWPFDWLYQPVSLLSCAVLGWGARAAAVGLSGAGWPLPAQMIFGGVVYLAFVAALVGVMPWLAGLSREELLLDLERAQGAASRTVATFLRR
jgi:O-antigen/teichoic acid export membrane protein